MRLFLRGPHDITKEKKVQHWYVLGMLVAIFLFGWLLSHLGDARTLWYEELLSAFPGIAGSALALAFIRRPLRMLAAIFFGGCLLSYYGGAWLAEVLHLGSHLSLAGFILGMCGMAIVAKLVETIEALQPVEIARAIVGALKRRLGYKQPEDKR
jgi:hypothetical protein